MNISLRHEAERKFGDGVKYEIISAMEIPLDGSNKFGRELVEGFILDKVSNKAKGNLSRDIRILNSKNPVTDNPNVPKGKVNNTVKSYLDKQYKKETEEILEKLGLKND